MTYKDLPLGLKPGDKIQCRSPAFTGNEILEVFKVENNRDGIHLMRENGVAIPGEFTLQTLCEYDYKLIVK